MLTEGVNSWRRRLPEPEFTPPLWKCKEDLAMLARVTAFVYGVICYLIFFVTFFFAIGFVGGLTTPRSVDSGPQSAPTSALLIDACLLGLFAAQHSLMARQWFKRAWTRVVPEPVERSTYVLFSSLTLLLLFWQWRPLGGVVWSVENQAGQLAIYALYFFGWLLLVVSIFMIDHFELFGLRQVWLYLRGRRQPAINFRAPGLYQSIRHPIYLSWLMVFWATPRMTAAHLVLALATMAYIFLAIQFEMRDLIRFYGDDYRRRRGQAQRIFPLRLMNPKHQEFNVERQLNA
jgi:methanethiol S-methyltransferase